jgi:peroxiredoxin
MSSLEQLPGELPVPLDDGAASHLPGLPMPDLRLAATTGGTIDISTARSARTVIYVYPMTGRPGVPLPTDWDFIPGARGCTPEACAFRDHYTELRSAGAEVYGLSSQPPKYQAEAAQRLHLPFALLSDEGMALAGTLRLPTFTVEGMVLYKRLTLIVRAGRIEHVFYPVFPPDCHADEVLAWLSAHSVSSD